MGLAAVGLVLGLGACSAHPGMALKVNDVSYTEAEISQGADQFEEMSGQEVSRQAMVSTLVTAQAFNELAANHDIVVDDQAIVDQIKAGAAQGSFAVALERPARAVLDIFRLQLISTQLQGSGLDVMALTEELTTIQSEADVQVSPRYGQFDAQGTLTPTLLGDVVTESMIGQVDPLSNDSQSGN